MPEGDTVWLTARRLDQALRDQPLTVFELRVPTLASVDLSGATVTQVLARGKHLLIRLDAELTLHSHLRMDGSWHLTGAGTHSYRYPDHLIRARLGTARWWATGYRIHDLALIATSHEDQLVGHLGPDLLGPDWDLGAAVRRLAQDPRRAVGEALLDQRALAGLGNMYKCESLFLERANPWSEIGALADLPRLIETARRLLLINRGHAEQSTTGLLARGRRHWVYQRAGEACLRCGTQVRRAEQGEPPRRRSTYWCPACQRLPGQHADHPTPPR